MVELVGGIGEWDGARCCGVKGAAFVWRQNKGISDDKCQACTRSTGFAGKELQVSSRWVVTVIKGRSMEEDWTGRGKRTRNFHRINQ